MGTSARIDELMKKFEENPRRYFAPLANEYRKSGNLEQAIEICRQHLTEQPGHMSGTPYHAPPAALTGGQNVPVCESYAGSPRYVCGYASYESAEVCG